jgi:hypothetical protein
MGLGIPDSTEVTQVDVNGVNVKADILNADDDKASVQV